MNGRSVLYYDATCPVCRVFVSQLMVYIGDVVDFVPTANPEEAKEFRFTDIFGSEYVGEAGISMMFSMYPQAGAAIPYVPEKYKEAVAKFAYKVGGLARSVIQSISKATKGCNCG